MKKYIHFKGGIYSVICEGTLESDNETIMVVYQGNDKYDWIRP